MNNNSRSHVLADKIKWIIAFTLIAVLCVGMALAVVKLWVKPDLFEQPEETTAEAENTDTFAVKYNFAAARQNLIKPSTMMAVQPLAADGIEWTQIAASNKVYVSFSSFNNTFTFELEEANIVYGWTIDIKTGSQKVHTVTVPIVSSTTDTSYSLNVGSLYDDGILEKDVEYTIYFSAFYAKGSSQMPDGNFTGNVCTFFWAETPIVSELPDPPTKTGYTFTGWYTDPDCTKPYTEDKVIGDITLYAGFRANTYTIVFNANTGSGSMSNQSMTYDTAANLTANAFTKTGYTFKGWANSAGGSIAYTNGQSVKNLSAEQGATVNLYAVWEANTYTITFNANGGTGSMSNQSMTYDQSKALTANAFTRKNHEFKGWATSAGGEVVYTNSQSVSNLTATNGGNVNLYAVWELISYNVSFSVDGQITSTIEVPKETAATLPEEPSKEGYNFIGWFLEYGTQYTNQGITADTVLTAKFEIIKCTVTFIVDGEVYARYECDYGTNLSELLSQNVNTLLYTTEGEYSQNF